MWNVGSHRNTLLSFIQVSGQIAIMTKYIELPAQIYVPRCTFWKRYRKWRRSSIPLLVCVCSEESWARNLHSFWNWQIQRRSHYHHFTSNYNLGQRGTHPIPIFCSGEIEVIILSPGCWELRNCPLTSRHMLCRAHTLLSHTWAPHMETHTHVRSHTCTCTHRCT